VALPERARRSWHRDYIAALLERDLQDIARIQRSEAMRNLVDVLAAWSSSYLDITRITKRLSIRRPTVETYINALEALYLVERLPAWTRTDYERVGRREKLFLADTGLMAALLDWRLEQVRLDPDRAGKMAETLAFTELMAQVDLDPDFVAWHYRDWEQREIDLLVERRADGALLGIEVKAAQSATREDFRHLAWFRDNLAGSRPFTGVVLYTGNSVAAFGPQLWAVPFSAFWSG
jgi:predicted AAA+ superfamily ATPase